MQTRFDHTRRRHATRTLLAALVASIVLGAGAPANPILAGPGSASASQAGTGGGGP
jgi:hypothetical protein